jgi:hypothetical protein
MSSEQLLFELPHATKEAVKEAAKTWALVSNPNNGKDHYVVGFDKEDGRPVLIFCTTQSDLAQSELDECKQTCDSLKWAMITPSSDVGFNKTISLLRGKSAVTQYLGMQ